jgi:hypothetical protein
MDLDPHRFLAKRVWAFMQTKGIELPEAAREAFRHLVAEYSNATHPSTDPMRCAQCDEPESANNVLLPIGAGIRHVWVHNNCWEAWRAARRARVIEELAAMGIIEPP